MNDTEAKDYARRLVDKGIDPETAVEIARKAQQAQEPQQAAQDRSSDPTPQHRQG